ncbi:MAG TPA: hypothetical protein VFE01_05015 [Terracidiphilus sp.]|nr:hypothetical protein [Terracidiphilus sp.]
MSEWRASFEAAIAITKTKIRAVQVMPDCYSREPGFAIDRGGAFVRSMPRKPIGLTPAVACAFVRDMQAFFAAGHVTIKKDTIAARQMHGLREYQGPREKPIRITDTRESSRR